MRLRFPEDQIRKLAERYSYTRGEQQLLDLRERVSAAGHLNEDQLKQVALWKSPRSAGRVDRNDPAFIREMSRSAFAAKNERSRIEMLTLMDGVQWPTASVILHFFHTDPYPILDFRALWSVGLDVPSVYTFVFWWPYVEFCRTIVNRNKVDMRTFDQALWQFSKENQPAKNSASKNDKSGSLANRIRDFVAQTAIRPALASGANEIRVRAGDVHSAMGLKQRIPAVCSALESRKLADACSVEIVDREGPNQGANAILVFGPREARGNQTPLAQHTATKKQSQRPTSGWQSSEDPADTVYWVSCVSQKRAAPAPARDLYTSDLFSKARAYVEDTGAPWLILSAKYGLVSPDDTIAPYDLTLNKMAIADRRSWADRVLAQLDEQVERPRHIVMLAGARYREFLEPKLRSMGIEVIVPMEGLRIGEQLSWLSHQVQHD